MKKRLLTIFLALCMLCTLIPISAVAANEDSSVYLGFTSDIHDSVSELDSWQKNVNAAIEPDLEYMLFCGDYSYQLLSGYISSFNDIVSVTTANIKNGGIYTSGNHDYSNAGTTLCDRPRSEFSSTPGFVRIGEALRTDTYIVYCFGAAWGDLFGSFTDNDIAALRAYLETAPDDRPIFILSHFPLHYLSSRTIINADKVISILNNYPNTVFVWGHNHSQSAENNYGKILVSGDKLRYSLTRSSDINFTYVCAGAMISGQQEPYDGLVAKINNGMVTFTYYDDTGKAVSEPRTVRSGSHNFTDYVYNNDATCTTDGTMTAKCDSCNKTDTIPDPEHPRTGHSFTNYVSDGNATCTEDGTMTAVCDNGCGETDTVADEGSAGHVDANGDFICDKCKVYEYPEEAKEAAAAVITELAGDHPTIAVKAIVNKALADIENAETVADVNAVKAQAITDIKAQQEKEAFSEPDWLKTLDEYLPTVGAFTRNLIKMTVSAIKDSEALINYLKVLFNF